MKTGTTLLLLLGVITLSVAKDMNDEYHDILHGKIEASEDDFARMYTRYL